MKDQKETIAASSDQQILKELKSKVQMADKDLGQKDWMISQLKLTNEQ